MGQAHPSGDGGIAMYQLLAFAVSLLLLSASPALGCNTHSDCSDGDPCTIASCEPVSRTCRHSAAIDGTRCNDGGACTQSDTCAGGRCDTGSRIACSVPDSCQGGTCVEGGGGDRDGDHICDADDNCPDYANDDQGDLDHDGIGDVCDGNDAKLIVTSLYIRGSRRT